MSHILINPDDSILEESSRRFRSEVSRDGLVLHQIPTALESLLEYIPLLKEGSNVVVSSSFSRTLLASPLIRKHSLANLVIKARLVSQRTGNPVYFVKNEKSNAKTWALELAWSAEIQPYKKVLSTTKKWLKKW